MKDRALRFLELILEVLIRAGPPPPEQPGDWRPPWLRKRKRRVGANTDPRNES